MRTRTRKSTKRQNAKTQIRKINRKILFEKLERRDLLSATPQLLPYFEDFSGGTKELSGWHHESSNEGRIEIVEGRLRQDDSVDGSEYSRNKSNLHLNLLNEENIKLTFRHYDINDEDTFSDGIHLSDDGGENFKKAWDAKEGEWTLDLDKLISDLNLSYTENFVIGFWQYDNYGATSDGREWDDIRVHSPPPPPPPVVQTVPYIQTFDILPTGNQGWEYNSTNDGRINIVNGRLRMDDSVNGGSYSLNEAILHLDTSAHSNVHLTGNYWNLSDELHDQDGIFVSVSGGQWVKQNVSSTFDINLVSSNDLRVKFAQYDNYSASSDGLEWDNIKVEVVVPPTPQVVDIENPYIQTFDTGILPTGNKGWEYNSTNDGRINIVNGRLRMDDSVNGGSYSLNEAILHLDIQGPGEAYLNVEMQSINDELHDEDGIFVLVEGNWIRYIPTNKSTIPLPKGLTAVKFQQYDNYGAPSDGREWYNIKIEMIDVSKPLSDWPAGIGVVANLWIDSGVSLSYGGSIPAAKALGWTYDILSTSSSSYQNSVIGGNPDDLNGVLLHPDGEAAYEVIFINGGNSSYHYNPMTQKTRDRYNEFIQAGGSSTGSCAGMYFQASYYNNMIPISIGQSGYGSDIHSVTFTDDDQTHPFIKLVHQYTDGDNIVNGISHQGGPYWNPSNAGGDPRFEFFGRIYNSGLRLQGSPYYGTFKAGPKTGLASAQPSHPEFATVGDKLGLQMAQIHYAQMNSYMTPDVKKSLTLGEVVSMNGPTQKVGINQYHLFEFTAKQDSEVTIKLDGMTIDNTDLYVQVKGDNNTGLANEKSYIASSVNTGLAVDEVTIPTVSGKTYSIAVKGVHSIKNGASYNISVNNVNTNNAIV